MKRSELEEHLCALATPRLMEAPSDLEVALTCYGLDSVGAVELTVVLEEWSGRRIPIDLLYECPSIRALADYFEGEQTSRLKQGSTMLADAGWSRTPA